MQDKVAIVTGASKGQGAAIAKRLAKEGARVVVTSRNLGNLAGVVQEIKQENGNVVALQQDVTQDEEWQGVVQRVVEEFDRIDVLVNNAGAYSYRGVDESTVEEWKWVMDTNALGVFLGMKRVVPVMRKNGGGSIVNTSSMYGTIGSGGSAAYHASKGAVIALTKTAAIEFAKDRIRVNAILPGLILTPMTQPIVADANTRSYFESLTPLGCLGQPEDVANGVLFLASDESSFMTGAELVMDGGFTAQ